ncbi:hypothetical protein [Sulfitobacter sp. CW3]|jgi:hypothetical protein|uniref:hypothetical protein n=1 Tax=Sulfitobacter sp. CW3 TaxID=2861965 RepID=UPI0021510B56|nr:hypothetical protein [Sulfitobacter sp. CW3]|tara:strand:- start:984 stop:1526 length:543 start_codon:yes stop_codon:yes gene_type:complete
MRQSSSIICRFFALLLLLWPCTVVAGEFDRFAGSFTGEAEFVFDGETQRRDMSTTIVPTKNGFRLSWTSVSHKDDGRAKSKTYNILFEPSGRKNIYSSAMRTNVFGKDVPLNPLKGEPYVWARLNGDTLSVFSLVIDETGEYEMQEYHRTLVAEGLELEFIRLRNGGALKEIRTLLHRID